MHRYAKTLKELNIIMYSNEKYYVTLSFEIPDLNSLQPVLDVVQTQIKRFKESSAEIAQQEKMVNQVSVFFKTL